MGKVLIVIAEIIGVIAFIVTVALVFSEYGFWWGVLALFFPPADLIFMFLVGTWIPVIIAIILYVVGTAVVDASD